MVHIIECKRIWEDGTVTPIDICVGAIAFIGPYVPASAKTKIEDKNSCAVAMTNGAVMRIDMGRAALKAKIKASK